MRCRLKSFIHGCALAATLSVGADRVQSAHVLGYLFDDAPGSATASPDGSAAGSAPALNIVGPAVIGADGSGVSGLPGDRALDNSAASGMGGTINSSGGRGTHAADFEAIDGLTSFTVAGWFKTALTAPIGGNAVLVTNRSGVAGYAVYGDPNVPGNLVLGVDNNSNSSAGFGATGEWVNFAVTYDGAALQPGPNVFFYAGGVNTPLTLVGSGTNTNGSGNDPVDNETAALSFGSRVLFGATDANPFDGLLDNFRIWNSVTPLTTLEPLRISDVTPVPEPASLALAALACCSVLAKRRRR